MVSFTKVATLASLAWGVLAFGAVYPWAYWPLLAMCVIAGLAGWQASPRTPAPSKFLMGALLLLAAAIAFQLVPLPIAILDRISPSMSALLNQYDLQFSTGLVRFHALSVSPSATFDGLEFVASFAVLGFGLARFLSAHGTEWLSRGIVRLGFVVALIGIVQKPLFNGRIYGFWTPIAKDFDGFGPFVNRNHFAGWMLMALPIAIGMLLAGIEKSRLAAEPDRHRRVLWFGSDEAARLMLSGTVVMVMAVSLVLTLSRSGIIAFGLALVLCGLLSVRRVHAKLYRTFALVSLAVLVVAVTGWVGADVLATRFSDDRVLDLDGRERAWIEGWNIVSSYPLTGTGFNTYGIASVAYQRPDAPVRFLQAHNDYLQWLAEGGILLAIPAGLIGVLLVREAQARFDEPASSVSAWWRRAGAVAGLLAIAVQETADFSLQVPGNAALCVVLCAIVIHQSRPHAHRA